MSTTEVTTAEPDERILEVVPILHASSAVATLIVGTFTYPGIPPTLRGC